MKITLYKYDFRIIFSYLMIILSYLSQNPIFGMISIGITFFESLFAVKKPKELILIQIVYIMQFQFYISQIGLPSSISYLTDFINSLLILHLLKLLVTKRILTNKYFFLLCSLIILFMLSGFISAYVYDFSLPRYLWAIRNTIRVMLFFLASISFIDFSIIKKSERLLEITFFFNAIFVFIQYNSGLAGDYIGGVFGTSVGVANTYMHLFLVVFACLIMSKNFLNKISMFKFLFYLFLILLISAISELKIIYVELPFIFLVTYFSTVLNINKIIKGVTIFIVGAFLVVFSLPILEVVSPFFKGFFNVESIISIASNSYTGSDDIGRLSAIQYVRERFFDYNIWKTLFGIGLGNAEYSQISTLVSPFYLQYGEWSHYNWFSLPFVMVETGIVGVLLYILFFISPLISLFFKKQKTYLELMTVQLSCLSLILFVYNITLRIEVGYLFVFMLSWGILSDRYSGELS